MPTTLKDEAVIVGIGQTPYTKNSGVSEMALAAEAVRKAIDDAGLKPSDVDIRYAIATHGIEKHRRVNPAHNAVNTAKGIRANKVPSGRVPTDVTIQNDLVHLITKDVLHWPEFQCV